MRILLLSIFLFASFIGLAQQSSPQSVLVLTLVKDWDKYSRRHFFTIYADHGVPGAESIYRLKTVQSIATGTPQGNDHSQRVRNQWLAINKDSVEYNYFLNESLALNHILNQGWQLKQIIAETKSNSSNFVDSYVSNFNPPGSLPLAKYFFEKWK